MFAKIICNEKQELKGKAKSFLVRDGPVSNHIIRYVHLHDNGAMHIMKTYEEKLLDSGHCIKCKWSLRAMTKRCRYEQTFRNP